MAFKKDDKVVVKHDNRESQLTAGQNGKVTEVDPKNGRVTVKFNGLSRAIKFNPSEAEGLLRLK